MTTTSAQLPLYLRSDTEIIEFRESLFFSEARRMAVLSELDQLIAEPPRHRTKSIAIVGAANSGKTRLIKRFIKDHPNVRRATHMEFQAISIDCAKLKRVEELSVKLLKGIHAIDADRGTHNQRVDRFLELSQAVRLRMILLDEFHDTLKSQRRGEDFLMLIKAFLNEGLIVVPVGTEKLEHGLNADPQLATRFNFKLGRLTDITDVGVIKTLIATLAQIEVNIVSDDLVRYVAAESMGNIGNIIDWVERCLRLHLPVTLINMQKSRSSMSF